MEQNISCSHSSFLWGSASSSHLDGHGDYKHIVFPRQAGGRDVLVCLSGDDRPPGLANKSVRDGMGGWDDPTGNKLGKGREKVVTGTPGLLFFPLLLSLAIVFSCGCKHENVTRPQLKVNGKWLKLLWLNYCLTLGFHIGPDRRFDWALGLTALCSISGCSLACTIILPPSKLSFPEIISHSFYPLSTKSIFFVPENLTEMCSGKAALTCPFTGW